jgi:UDP-glucose 4-epimerase
MHESNVKKAPVCLVTGGAGFIGSHVAQHALDLGFQVVVLDDLSGGFERNVPKNALLVKGNICNVELIEHLFQTYQFDYVYHLAAYAAEGLSHFIRNFNYRNNLLGSINLINASVRYKIKRLVFTSSIAVYGENVTPMVETLTPMPEDPYGISKHAVEMDLKAANKMFGLEYTIFRPHNVYGPKQHHGDTYRNVLGIFMNQILKKQPITVFGDGLQTRAFSYIDDVAPYIVRCVTMPETINEIFNIGADRPYTIKELTEELFKAVGDNYGVNYLPERNEVKHAFSDHTKAQKIFKIENTTHLHEGVARMVKWAKEIGEMHPTRFDNIEVTQNMPPSWAKLI